MHPRSEDFIGIVDRYDLTLTGKPLEVDLGEDVPIAHLPSHDIYNPNCRSIPIHVISIADV